MRLARRKDANTGRRDSPVHCGAPVKLSPTMPQYMSEEARSAVYVV
jgi:hypothetical protein